MATKSDILLIAFHELAESFLWKGDWISADEWTKYIKTAKGMAQSDHTVADVNRALKKEAVFVSKAYNTVAKPTLFCTHTTSEKRNGNKRINNRPPNL